MKLSDRFVLSPLLPKLLKELLRKIVYPIVRPPLLRVAKVRLKERTGRCRTLEDYANLGFSFSVGSLTIRPAQIKEEILRLMKLLIKLRPKIFFEIGTAKGGTLYLLSKVSKPNATIISVDFPGGPFGGGYPEGKIPFYKSLVSDEQTLHLIQGDSHSSSTVEKLENILKGRKIDFLFIDGDHTYEGVRRDFEIYSKFVDKGIIAFHDIVPHLSKLGVGVSKFWLETKNKFSYEEIVKDWNQGWAGIGVIYVGSTC